MELELFSLPWNGSERNSESFLVFFHGMEFLVSSSTEWFRKEFREFASISVPRYRIPSIFFTSEWFGPEF
jgi:hypothetical protein